MLSIFFILIRYALKGVVHSSYDTLVDFSNYATSFYSCDANIHVKSMVSFYFTRHINTYYLIGSIGELGPEYRCGQVSERVYYLSFIF